MKPLSLLLWVAQRLTVVSARKMSDYRPDDQRRRLDLGTFTEAELQELSLQFGLAEADEIQTIWREALDLLEQIDQVEPFSCEVVETRKGFRLAHPAFGPQSPEWCLAQAAGYLRAALACYRKETILRPDLQGRL